MRATPFALLWLPPIFSVVLAWAAQTTEMSTLAKFIIAYPLCLIAISCFWYVCGDYVVSIL